MGRRRRTIDPTKNVLDLVRAESAFRTRIQEAETRRIDQLAGLRAGYDKQIADMLAASVKDKSDLVSTQLAGIQVTMNSRLSLLEQFRWETGGASRVADPALSEALAKMARSIEGLTRADNRGAGGREMIGWIVSGVLAIATIVSLVFATRGGW